MKPHAIAPVALAALVHTSHAAAQQDPASSGPPHRPQVLLGGAFGTTYNTLSIAGDEWGSQGSSGGWGASLGYSHPLGESSFALVAALRYRTWRDDWSVLADEGRTRFDLAIGPEIRRWTDDDHRIEACFGVDLGPSLGLLDPPSHRTFHEDYPPGLGFHLGAGLSGRFMPRKYLGAFVGVNVSHAWLWLERHAYVPDQPAFDARESYRFSTWELFVRAGYVLVL